MKVPSKASKSLGSFENPTGCIQMSVYVHFQGQIAEAHRYTAATWPGGTPMRAWSDV